MPKRKAVGLPRVRKSKNTQYRRTLLKFSIPSVLDFVREDETELQTQQPFSVKLLPIGNVLSNPWVVSLATGLIVAAISSIYW